MVIARITIDIYRYCKKNQEILKLLVKTKTVHDRQMQLE